MDNKKLYVGNLPWTINSQGLKDVFAEFGEVVEAIVISDKFSGRSKGFGFVTFADESAAQNATAAMNEKEVEGRKIVVNFAKPKEDRGANGDRRGDRRDYRG